MKQRLLLPMLLLLSLIGSAGAQETTGDVADEVKKEILKLAHQKVQALMAGGFVAADYLDRHDVDGIAYVGNTGDVMNKHELVEEWRSGVRKVHSLNEYDHQVHVYQNGTVAVVTYLGSLVLERKGKVTSLKVRTTEVFVKQDGKWRTVVHNTHEFSKQ